MSVIILVGLLVLLLLDVASIAEELIRWRAMSTSERKVIVRRRIAIHLGFYAVIVVGFLAIIYFGPLRPVHEWIR